jgi:hypothetical protein
MVHGPQTASLAQTIVPRSVSSIESSPGPLARSYAHALARRGFDVRE